MEPRRIPDHSQRFHRLLAALEPGYIRVDERSQEELIAFAVEFAALLIFHEQDGSDSSAAAEIVRRDWSDLFKGDVTFLLATMCTVDSKREFYDSIAPPRMQSRPPGQPPADDLRDQTIESALRIDRWYTQALESGHFSTEEKGDSNVETALRTTLAKSICERLAPLLLNDEILRSRWQTFIDGHTVSDIWKSTPGTEIGGRGPSEQDIRDIYNEFNRATAQLVDVAKEYLLQSLQEKNDHSPHGALYLAFVCLLVKSQTHFNGLTERHLDFYYRKVLRLDPRDETPDTTHVTFKLAPGVGEYLLEKGTLLVAGKDADGEDIHYRVDEDVLLNRANVVSLKALALPRDTDIDPSILGHESVGGVLAFPKADSADGRGKPLEHLRQGWPPFGGAVAEDDPGAANGEEDAPGLLISSPVLNLSEGDRRLRLCIRFAGGRAALDAALESYARGIQSKYEGVLESPTFEYLLSDAFRISYSTANGFREAHDVNIERDKDNSSTMAICFVLDASQPALGANDRIASEKGIRGGWPILKITLNPRSRVFPYSFLSTLSIEEISIHVSVSGLSTLFLHNGMGPVDAGKAFTPFGPLPGKGAELLISSDELREKTLNRVRLRVEWANLPSPPEDLAGYYTGYGRDTANDSFRASFSVLDRASWRNLRPAQSPPEDEPDNSFALFIDDSTDAEHLQPRRCWDFALDGVRFAPRKPLGAPIRFDGTTQDGFFRLRLVAPSYGFGSELYPQLLVDTVAANALLKKVAARKALPKPPFVPEIKRLQLDYTASAQLVPGGVPSTIYHAHPFDGTSTKLRDSSMIPIYGEKGYLLIGLADLEPPQPLTLLFCLHEAIADKWIDSADSGDTSSNDRIRWRYLADDEWRDFDRDDVIADDTRGFARSGIVKLRIPRDITKSRSQLDPGKYWLQVAALRDIDRYGSMIDVVTQAVSASRVSVGADMSSLPAIPPGTISALAEPVAEILTVNQPIASNGGRARESTDAFRIRVSERLRHKQRAIHPGDYEALVLEAFPEIREAKAFGHGAGRVMVVVVPMGSGEVPESEPRVPEYLLEQIAGYLRQFCSSFVEEICVRNPWYEPLEVSAWVKFSRDYADESLPVLERALDRFIAPWRYDRSVAMDIGTGVFDLPQLRGFLERQPYVHQLTGLSIVHVYKTEDGDVVRHRLRDSSRSKSGYSMFRASTPWSVLVSAKRHELNILREHTGIGDLEIASDFIVTSSEDAELLSRGQLRYPRRPAKAGIGNLEIGNDFIMTTEEDAVPES